MTLAIIDCNIGNIGSLRNAFAFLGAPATVVSDPAALAQHDAVVLPGVGAFDAAMQSIHRARFDGPIKAFAASGRPLLGICLGLQLLCARSDEGVGQGLGLVDAEVINLRTLGCEGKVPHVGFNSIISRAGPPSKFLDAAIGQDFYYVHSFGLQSSASIEEITSVAFTEYEGATFVGALQKGNIFATQFHPEKSGEVGLALLAEFISCSRSA